MKFAGGTPGPGTPKGTPIQAKHNTSKAKDKYEICRGNPWARDGKGDGNGTRFPGEPGNRVYKPPGPK